MGIPRRHLINIRDRYNGQELWALPTPVFDPSGGLEDSERLAEVSLSAEEANTLMNRVAYSLNEVIDDMRGLSLKDVPDLPDEVERLSETSGSRTELTSETPSPGADRLETRMVEEERMTSKEK